MNLQMIDFVCASLDDLEELRIATENRLRALTRTEADSDGEIRGLGYPETDPNVIVFTGVLDGLREDERLLTRMLEQQVKAAPLGPWILTQRGVGLKQAGRLLGAVGDPYWNTLYDRPRTVAELWAYCGLVPGQKRQKGVVDNWSSTAKMRLWNITQSTLKQPKGTPWRDLWDTRRAATRDRVHATECRRCGPSGKPALPGSPWSLAHAKADADRYVGKRLLRELWREARRLREVESLAA
jgi:hypothetical protein